MRPETGDRSGLPRALLDRLEELQRITAGGVQYLWRWRSNCDSASEASFGAGSAFEACLARRARAEGTPEVVLVVADNDVACQIIDPHHSID